MSDRDSGITPEVPSSRAEFTLTLDDVDVKLETLMPAMSQKLHGASLAAAGGKGESRGGMHAAPGADQQAYRAPNTADRTRQGQGSGRPDRQNSQCLRGMFRTKSLTENLGLATLPEP